jgi:hypothetical protein
MGPSPQGLQSLSHLRPPSKAAGSNPTPTSSPIMEQKSNMHKRTTTHQPSIRWGRNLSKRSLECFCSLHGRLTGDYFQPSALLLLNGQTQWKKPWDCVSNFWFSCPHRKKQYSHITRATWFLQSTATHRTYPNPKPAAALEATCSWQGRSKIPSNNGAVLNISQKIRTVVSSMAEAELTTVFINAKTAV